MIEQIRQARLLRALMVPLVVLAWLAVLLIVAWLLSHVTRALLILVLGALIAFALSPLVNLLSRWIPRLAAIAVAYVLALVVVLGVLSLVVLSAATEITNLARNLPWYVQQAQAMHPQVVGFLGPWGVGEAQVREAEIRLVEHFQGLAADAAANAIDLVTHVLNAVVDAILVLMLSVYLVANGPALVRWLREQAPRGQRRRANLLIRIVNQVVGGYVRGSVILCSMVGSMVGLGMAVLGVRYALLLGLVAFFFEFIPVLGVLVSGSLCVLVALLDGWVKALLVLGYFVVVHVIEGDFVAPRVMGQAVGVHPAVAILALIAGSELFGLWGALLGAPLAGLLQAIVLAAWREVRAVRGMDEQEAQEAVARLASPRAAQAAPQPPPAPAPVEPQPARAWWWRRGPGGKA